MRLKRGGEPGVWHSADGHWTFLRAFSDPQPHRWFAYREGDDFPSNDGLGHTRLADAVDWAAEEDLVPPWATS